MRVVVSDKAKTDLLRIYRYINERSPRAADALIQRVDTAFKNLSQFPFIGREREHLGPGLRCLVVRVHLIFYTIDADRITVVRVIDGRMDVDEEFQR